MYVYPQLPLDRGQYEAKITNSGIASWYSYLGRKPRLYQALCADADVFQNGKLLCKLVMGFFIKQEGGQSRAEWQALQSWLKAAGLDRLENASELEGKTFRLVVWDAWKRRFSFRPALGEWSAEVSGDGDCPQGA